jgi:biopolymer transport protein ExbB/TolQ
MQSFNVMDMWHHMGVLDKSIVLLLVGMSMYSIWVMIDRFVALRKAHQATDGFVAHLSVCLDKNDVEGAAKEAKRAELSPVAHVVDAMIEEYTLSYETLMASRGDEVDLDVVDAITREITRMKEAETSGLKRGLSGLASISSAAPFIGLFGTVVGIINAFRSMAESGQGGLGAVSSGIAEALFTTATGLVVAIPALMAFNFFTAKVEEQVLAMNDISTQVLNYLIRTVKATKRAA